MPGKPRKVTPGDPDFMNYGATGDLLQAFLTDAAADYKAKTEANGTSSLASATLRIVLQAAHQLRDVHGLNEKPETADESSTDENGWQG